MEDDTRQDMADQIKKGLAEERKEHKWMNKETVKKLVMDHLAIDPEYYGEDDDEDEEYDTEEIKPPEGTKGYTNPRPKAY